MHASIVWQAGSFKAAQIGSAYDRRCGPSGPAATAGAARGVVGPASERTRSESANELKGEWLDVTNTRCTFGDAGFLAALLPRRVCLYGPSRDDTDYVIEIFPIVRKNNEKARGEYRTKRVILEVYDVMAEAAGTGKPYQTRHDPPSADPLVAQPDTRRTS
jgi:hypothetical protein